MSDPNRRGLNPDAPSFVPNANATPFVPGQPYQFVPQQQLYGQQPPNFPTGAPFYPPNMAYMPPNYPPPHMQQFQVPPPQAQPQVAQQPTASQSSTAPPAPAESWDDNVDESEPEPKSEDKPSEPPKVESKDDVIEKPIPVNELAKAETLKVEPVDTKPSVPASEPISAPTEEIAAVTTKIKNVTIIPDENRKEHINIVFIGHVDAGKSTIGGQLMYLTGMVDKRTLEKYEKEAKDKGRESWYLSWALDTNEEEREKGKTVECGRAFFETERKHFTILDAPGHKSFVPNMISGATQADLAVLVISARKGEFETGFDRGGQTREHAMLAKSNGVKHLIILVNKMDDPTVSWDEERYLEIQNKLTPYLRKCGFNPKSDITYIPCSGLTGAFLKDRPDSDQGSWYSGPCFLEYIDNMLPKMTRDFSGPIRCIIADKYSDMGTVVIGKMESGAIEKGQNVLLMPNRSQVQVTQCWSDDVETNEVFAGDNVKLKLRGVEDSDILSGFVICSLDNACHVGKIFDAETIICKINKKTGAKEKARFVKQDEKCIMRLESAEAFCLEKYADFPVMGRFTLRDEGKTLAIGKIVKVVE